MFLPSIFLFLLPFTQSEEYNDLVLDSNYTHWTTQGNLTPIFFRVVLDTFKPPFGIRVSVSTQTSTLKNPLTVNIIRGKTVHSIALPRVQSHQGKKFSYGLASDTLCDEDDSIEQLRQPVYLSIASSLPSDFLILVKTAMNFRIMEGLFETRASPCEPRYYVYTFPEYVDKVDIRVYADDGVCSRLFIRQLDCPLFDGSGLIELSENYYYQTFTKFAGFSVRKADIGPKFHLAITVLSDDSLCGTVTNVTENPYRIKTTRFIVTPVSEQTLISLIPLVVYGLSMIVVVLLTFFKYRLLDRFENNEPSIFEGNDSEANVILDKTWLFEKPIMVVSHKEYQKQRVVKDAKYFNFLFFQIFGSILPALTTLFQSIQEKFDNKNLDMYYINFLCALDTLQFNSFNSVTSVSSVAIIGVVNLIVVFRKKIFCYQVPRQPTTHGIHQREAPKVVFLLSLVAMGVLGVVSNNCADKSTIHLFIYNVSWLYFSAIMWIYSKRHGVRKWQQFYIIAISSVFACFTLVEEMFRLNPVVKIILKVMLLITVTGFTGYFCYQYYFERPSGLQDHQWIKSPFFKSHQEILGDNNGIYRPLWSKMFYVVAAMVYSIYYTASIIPDPHKSITLAIIYLGKGHVAIYFFYYIIQKIRFETSSFTRSFMVINTILITLFVIFEGVFNRHLVFSKHTFAVWLTPAQSRELNSECVLPGIDWNDILHYNGAISYFIFIVLMDFIDSNIKGVPKKHIFVF